MSPRIVLEQLVSADGFAAEPDGGMRCVEAVSFEVLDRTDEHQMEFVATIDAIVPGRVTYEMFREYWPMADPEYDKLAGPINSLPKLVDTIRLRTVPTFVGEGLGFTPPTRTPLVGRLGEQWRYSTGHVTTEYHLRD